MLAGQRINNPANAILLAQQTHDFFGGLLWYLLPAVRHPIILKVMIVRLAWDAPRYYHAYNGDWTECMGRVVNFKEAWDIPPPELAVHAAMSKDFQSGAFGYPIPIAHKKSV
jgi:hypothetical protein